VVWSKQHILRFFCKCWFDEAKSVSVFFNDVLWNQLREWSTTLVSRTGRIYTSKTSRLVDWSYEFSFSSDKETNGIWATSIEHEKWSREGRVQLGRLFSKCAKRMLLVLKPLNLSQAATPTSRFWAALSNSTTTCDPKIHKARPRKETGYNWLGSKLISIARYLGQLLDTWQSQFCWSKSMPRYGTVRISHRIHGAAIYGNIYHQYTPNVSIYTIHGSYGLFKKSVKSSICAFLVQKKVPLAMA